jgi:predicted HNH restriction endonuclease
VVPLSEIQAEYVVDPIKDLVPICPNCHAMLHRTIPALSVGDLKAVLKEMSAKVPFA